MSAPAHEHEWMPNGIAELPRESCSPVSRWDDLLWIDQVSVLVCKCGKSKTTRVGSKNVRRRGDDLRTGRSR